MSRVSRHGRRPDRFRWLVLLGVVASIIAVVVLAVLAVLAFMDSTSFVG